jgi:hypothetical protein
MQALGRPLLDDAAIVRTPHPIVKRPSRVLQHVVFDLEYTSVEVLVAPVKSLEVPIALADQGILSPLIGHERHIGHEAHHDG